MSEVSAIVNCCVELYSGAELQRTKFMLSELKEAYPDLPQEVFIKALELAKQTKNAGVKF